MGVYPNLPLGGLNSNELGRGSLDEDLFNQLKARQLQSQLMQANQQAALMGASAGMYFIFLGVLNENSQSFRARCNH